MHWSFQGIGCFVVLLSVPSTHTFLGTGNTPVIRSSHAFIVINDNFILPERPLNTRGTDTSGGILHGVRVKPQAMEIYDTSCDGRMCDQATLFTNGALKNHCACMQMDKSGKTIIVLTVTVRQTDGSEFDVSFASKWFMLNFLLSGQFPVGTCADDFTRHYDVNDRMWDAVEAVFQYINDNGGFRAFVWAKRGVVEDAGVGQPDGYGAERIAVESGILNHHLARIEPMEPEKIDVLTLWEKQFNVDTGFSVGGGNT